MATRELHAAEDDTIGVGIYEVECTLLLVSVLVAIRV